jgi:hypothetical protein
MAHPMTHENTAAYRNLFGIGIGFWMRRIPIAIPIPIANRTGCGFISEAVQKR